MTTTTTKAIQKGDSVYLFGSWDDKGTFAWSQWIVDSCGKVQMHLRADDGNMRERRVYISSLGVRLQVQRVADTPDPKETALRLAAEYLSSERAQLESLIARNQSEGEGYIKAMQKELADLHEPQEIEKRF